MTSARKLFQLQFPPLDEGKVCLHIIYIILLTCVGHSNTQVARQVSWQAQVEEAIIGESDEFEQQVCIAKAFKYKCTQFYMLLVCR